MQPISHTHVTGAKKTPTFTQFGFGLGARYGGRALFKFLGTAGLSQFDTEKKQEIATGIFSGVIAGAISLYTTVTGFHDVKNIFSETVGLELGKDPQTVTWRDLKRSDNALVKDAVKSTGWLGIMRLIGTSGFFLSALPIPIPGMRRAYDETNVKGKHIEGVHAKEGDRLYSNDAPAAEIGMFTFAGIALGHDVLRKVSVPEAFAEVLVKFSKSGVGQSVTAGDLGQLYQIYAREHAPNRQFSDISDISRWNGAEILFQRMAELMEYSYRSRADVATVARGEATEIRVKPQQNFQMPTFQYLLGHGLINPDTVRESLIYVEVANRYGIEAVKDIQIALSNGGDMERLMEKYPVVIPGEGLELVVEGAEPNFAHPTKANEATRFTDRISPKAQVPEPSIGTDGAHEDVRRFAGQFAKSATHAERALQGSQSGDLGLAP